MDGTSFNQARVASVEMQGRSYFVVHEGCWDPPPFSTFLSLACICFMPLVAVQDSQRLAFLFLPQSERCRVSLAKVLHVQALQDWTLLKMLVSIPDYEAQTLAINL